MATGKEVLHELLLASASARYPGAVGQSHAESLTEHTILQGTDELLGGRLIHWTLSIMEGGAVCPLGHRNMFQIWLYLCCRKRFYQH